MSSSSGEVFVNTSVSDAFCVGVWVGLNLRESEGDIIDCNDGGDSGHSELGNESMEDSCQQSDKECSGRSKKRKFGD